MLDELAGAVHGDGGDALGRESVPVVATGQVLLDRRGDLGVEDDTFFRAQRVEVCIARQCGLDAATGEGLLTRHGPAHSRPVVQLLLGGAALACPLGSCAVDQVCGDTGDTSYRIR